MSGKNQMQLLKEMFGDDVGRIDQPTIPLGMVYFHPKGHPLRHPRAEDPVDPELRDDIVAKGITDSILVRIEYVKDKPVAALCFGACRTISGLAAEKIMRKQESKLLDRDGNLRVKVKFLKDDSDATFLLERRAEDRQRLKRPHSTRVVCDEVVSMARVGVTTEQMLDGLSRDWTPTVVTVVAEVWHTASPELRARCNADPQVPPGLLPAVLRAPPSARLGVLDQLLAAEVKDVGGATRALNKAARAMALDDDDIEHDGLGQDDDEAGESDAESEDDAPASTRARVSAKKLPATAAPRLKVAPPVERPSAKLVNRLAADLGAKERVTDDERAFVLGVQCTLDREYAEQNVVKLLASVPPAARAALAGVLWRQGVFSAKVQEHVSADVLALLDGARKPKPADKTEKVAAPKRGKKKAREK